MAAERAAITHHDRTSALAVVTEWMERHDKPGARTTTRAQLELVGMITAALADARALERERIAEGLESEADTLDDAIAEHYRHLHDTLRGPR